MKEDGVWKRAKTGYNRDEDAGLDSCEASS